MNFSNNKLKVVKANPNRNSCWPWARRAHNKILLLMEALTTVFNLSLISLRYTYAKQHHILIEGEILKVNGANESSFSFEKKTWCSQTLYCWGWTLSSIWIQIHLVSLRTKHDGRSFPMYGTKTGIAEDMNLDGKINFITAGESGTLYNYAVEWFYNKVIN